MMMGYGFGGPFSLFFSMILHLAFVTCLIMGAIWMFKALFYGGCQAEQQKGAVEILKQRYAKGEIVSEEYQRIKRELE